MSERRRHAKGLFAPLAPTYDRVGAVLSFGQDPRWRRFMVSRLPGDGGTVLDVATGTGLVAKRCSSAGSASRASTRARRCWPPPGTGSGPAVELVEASATEPAVRRRLVRPPHVHLPAALRRRSRARRCASLPVSCAREARWQRWSSACRAARGAPLWDLYVGVGLPAGRPPDLAGLARGGEVPRPLDPWAVRAAPARPAARAVGRGRASATSVPAA